MDAVRMEDGGGDGGWMRREWRMKNVWWKTEDERWKTEVPSQNVCGENGKWRMRDGGWRAGDGRMEDGGWRMERMYDDSGITRGRG